MKKRQKKITNDDVNCSGEVSLRLLLMWIEELASDYAEEMMSEFDVATELISDIKMFRKISLGQEVVIEVSLASVGECTLSFEGRILDGDGHVVAKVDKLEYMAVALSGAPISHELEMDDFVEDTSEEVCIVKLPYFPLSYRVIPKYC